MVAALMILIACKKTQEADPLPQNRILAFKVTNLTDTVIYGAVDHTDNTITVYMPFYYGLTLIDPKIELSPGARLSEEILPVKIEDVKSYTVVAPDGSRRTYQLSIVLQNTPALQVTWGSANLLSYPRANLPIVKGNFWARNRALLRLTMKHQQSGKVITLDAGQGNMQINSADEYSFGGVAIPADADTGYYQLQVGFMNHQVNIDKPLHIVHRQPGVSVLSKVVKPGGTISFNSTVNSVLLDLRSAAVTIGGIKYDLPVETYSRTAMVLKVPSVLPVGNYPFLQFDFEFNGWQTVTAYGSLTVEPQ